ncbi:unnamed protein product [Trichobilharzia regenti]|nr:unnamed protein product [Trichobilharzia regenti]
MSNYSPSTTLGRTNAVMHFVTNTANTLNSMGALTSDSNATSLVSSSISAFSPSVSSDGSSTCPVRSLSQRSSPGGLSSSSSSSSSSTNTSNPASRQSFRIDDDYATTAVPSREINSTGSLENMPSVEGVTPRSSIIKPPIRIQSRSASSPSRSSSPPSILSAVPSFLPTNRKSADSPIYSLSQQSLNSGSCELADNLSGRPKRRKFR